MQSTSGAYDYDTDAEQVMESDDGDEFSSDEECPPRMSRVEEERMYERERQMAFRGRLTVGDPQSMLAMQDDIRVRCGCAPSTSVPRICANREIGGRARPALNSGAKTAVINRYFPNSRKIVQKIQCKTFCCQYVKEGQELVVASQDEKIRFFSKNSDIVRHSNRYVLSKELEVQVCNWSILDVALNKEGTGLCYGTWKDAVFYGQLTEPSQENTSGVKWHALEIPGSEHHTAVFSVRFSSSGREVLCGSSDYSLHMFDIETKAKILTIPSAHEDDVNTVCYGDDSSHLIFSAGDDGLVKVWDRRAWAEADNHPVGVFAGHRDGITYVDSRHDGRYLLSNCKDQTIKLWDLRSFSSDEGINATRNCVRLQKWDYRWQPAPPGLCQPVAGDTSVLTLRGHNVLHTLVRAKFSPERTGKRYIYSGCARGEVVVYDLLTGAVSNRLKGHVAVVRDVDWNPEENEIACCSWDGNTSVWQWDERKARPTSSPDDEDSCDEMWKPRVRREKVVAKRRLQRTIDDMDMSDCEQ